MNKKPKYIKHHKIDKTKWDECISKSTNRLPHAYSFYLDLISPNWDAIILGDYKTVMPLTHRKKMGISYVTRPVLCQQLGAFSRIDSKPFYIDDFIQAIPKKFIKIDMPVNAFNLIKNPNIVADPKINQTICLDRSHDEIHKSFGKSHRKHIRKFEEKIDNFNIKKDSVSQLLKIRFNALSSKDFTITKEDIKLYHKVLKSLEKKGLTETYTISDADHKVLCGISFCKIKEIVYPISFVTPDGRKNNGKYYLMNEFFKRNSPSELSYDFMGSSLPSINHWNKGFGAEESTYTYIHINRLRTKSKKGLSQI